MKIQGLHHITLVSSNAQRTVDFYVKVLGLRLIKQTVNFDQNMKGEVFLNTLLHEIFHIIIFNEGLKVKDRGEEPIVMALGDGLTKVLKQNKKVRDYIYDCFDSKKMV